MAGRVSEIVEIEVSTAGQCKDPIYLRWLNSLGGWNFWLFTNNNTMKFRSFNTLEQQVYKEDFTEGESLTELVKVSGEFSLQLFEDALIRDYIILLNGLRTSVNVSVLLNPFTWETDGENWRRVLVEPESIDIGDRKASLFTFSVTIRDQPLNLPWA